MRFEYLVNEFLELHCRIAVVVDNEITYKGMLANMPYFLFAPIKDNYVVKLSGGRAKTDSAHIIIYIKSGVK